MAACIAGGTKQMATSDHVRSISLILMLFALTGCNRSVIRHNDSYTLQNTDLRLRCAIVFQPDVIVFYEGGAGDVFTENPTALIDRYLREEIPAAVKRLSIIDTAFVAEPLREYSKDTVTLRGRNGAQHSIVIPKDTISITFTQKPHFVMLLDSLHVSVDWQGPYTPGAPFPGAGQSGAVTPSKDLIIESAYVLWDNDAGTLVSHGYVSAAHTTVRIVTLDDWDQVVQIFVNQIIDGSALAL